MLDMLQEPDPRPSVFEGLAAKSTPLMVSGFTEDGLHHLNENLKPFGLTSYAVPTGLMLFPVWDSNREAPSVFPWSGAT